MSRNEVFLHRNGKVVNDPPIVKDRERVYHTQRGFQGPIDLPDSPTINKIVDELPHFPSTGFRVGNAYMYRLHLYLRVTINPGVFWNGNIRFLFFLYPSRDLNFGLPDIFVDDEPSNTAKVFHYLSEVRDDFKQYVIVDDRFNVPVHKCCLPDVEWHTATDSVQGRRHVPLLNAGTTTAPDTCVYADLGPPPVVTNLYEHAPIAQLWNANSDGPMPGFAAYEYTKPYHVTFNPVVALRYDFSEPADSAPVIPSMYCMMITEEGMLQPTDLETRLEPGVFNLSLTRHLIDHM